jgi:hypothetical protein
MLKAELLSDMFFSFSNKNSGVGFLSIKLIFGLLVGNKVYKKTGK